MTKTKTEPKAAPKVEKELIKLSKISKRTEKESQQDWLARLCRAVNTIDDKIWAGSSAAAQAWQVEAVNALNAKTDLPIPPGSISEDDDDDDTAEDSDEDSEDEASEEEDDDGEEEAPAKPTKKKKAKKEPEEDAAEDDDSDDDASDDDAEEEDEEVKTKTKKTSKTDRPKAKAAAPDRAKRGSVASFMRLAILHRDWSLAKCKAVAAKKGIDVKDTTASTFFSMTRKVLNLLEEEGLLRAPKKTA